MIYQKFNVIVAHWYNLNKIACAWYVITQFSKYLIKLLSCFCQHIDLFNIITKCKNKWIKCRFKVKEEQYSGTSNKTRRESISSEELSPGSSIIKNNTCISVCVSSKASKKYLKNNFEDSEKYKCYEFDENKLLNYRCKDYNPKLSFAWNNTFILSFSNRILYLKSQD